MRPKGSKYFPTRVIDVQTDGVSGWRLQVSASDFNRDTRYMTLSHRWGEIPFLTLTRKNLHDLYTGLPLSNLPRTFQDAIAVVRRFGIRYLWIDSLCIIQDSMEDWLAESEKMKDVYINSVCNLAADWSGTKDGGCFYDRDPRSVDVTKIKIGWEDEAEYMIIDSHLWEDCIARAPLNTRAWALQEKLLSPRVLHFGQEQMFWECAEQLACETFPSGMPMGMKYEHLKVAYAMLKIKGSIMEDIADTQAFWYEIVEMYSRCFLTKSHDKLIALSGVVRRFQQMSDDRYFAGLWEQNLACQLLWIVPDFENASRCPSYRAPSWSWACLDGLVDAHQMRERTAHAELLVKILEVECKPARGLLESAVIRFEGTLLSVENLVQQHFFRGNVTIGRDTQRIHIYPDVMPTNSPDKMYYLPITVHQSGGFLGLALARTNYQQNKYERFGYTTMASSRSLEDFKLMQRETIMLI
jgi:Heterokaryon incompatibility protein (HET)